MQCSQLLGLMEGRELGPATDLCLHKPCGWPQCLAQPRPLSCSFLPPLLGVLFKTNSVGIKLASCFAGLPLSVFPFADLVIRFCLSC